MVPRLALIGWAGDNAHMAALVIIAAPVRVYRVPHSTNVVRIALACGVKGVAVEWVDVDPTDRSEVVRVSGQPLVPVLVAGDGEAGAPGTRVITDSPRILHWLEEQFPEPPLLPDPADPHARATVELFCDWFNRVWKRPPNAIDAEEAKAARGEPVDTAAIAGWSQELRASLDLFEGLLAGGDFLFGDRLTLADVTAWPFLLYPVLGVPASDTDRFHHILVEHLPLGDGYPRLRAWVRRVAALPLA